MGVMRLGHVCLKVLSVEAATEHYTQVIGLQLTHRAADGSVFLKGWDEWDRYSLVLRPSDEAGVEHIAFKVRSQADLDRLKARMIDAGIVAEDVPPDELPFCSSALHFTLPSGHSTYLYAEKQRVGRAVGERNPEPWPDGLVGAGVHWLDHVMLIAQVDPPAGINKVAESVAFLTDVLDFKLCEQVVAGPEQDVQVAAWLSRTSTPHDIAFGAGDRPGLHHISFFVDDWNDVLKAADILAKKRVHVDVTPQRHGITRGSTTYFFDPSGNRNEIFAGLGYLSQPDMPLITWTEDELWRGIFYHTGAIIGDFLSVHT